MSITPARVLARVSTIALAASILVVVSDVPAVPAPADLDTTFDLDGKLTTPLDLVEDHASDVVEQTDGKIVVVGYAKVGTSRDFAIARYNTDGSLDPTFDGEGRAYTSFSAGNDEARAVVLQSDGKIVVVGAADFVPNNSSTTWAVARYNADGSLDTTFDGDGKLTIDLIETGDEEAHAVLVDPDGRIVVAGSARVSTLDFAVARLTSAGALDATFDTDGMAFYEFGQSDTAFGIARQSDGKLVVAGETFTPGNATGRFAVMRIAADGALDATFDGDGMRIDEFTGYSDATAYDVEIQPSDSKIIIAGDLGNGGAFGLIRLGTNGSPDVNFGDTGKQTTTFLVNGLSRGAARGVEVLPDGKILAGGDAIYNMAVARYTAEGGLDASFSSDGKATTKVSNKYDVAGGFVADSSGRPIIVGDAQDDLSVDPFSLPPDFALVRFDTVGALDNTFDADGKARTAMGFADNVANAVAVQTDGKTLIAGRAIPGATNDFAFARYTATGALDTTFDVDGLATVNVGTGVDIAHAVTLQTDGKIVAAGEGFNGTDQDFTTVRLSSAGALDAPGYSADGRTFTDFGTGDDAAQAVVVLPDGDVLAAGWASAPGATTRFAIARFNSDGSLDGAFGTSGTVTTVIGADARAYAMAVQGDGKIILAGGSDGDIAVARYTAAGALDTTFDSDGWRVDSVTAGADVARGVAIGTDGTIVVAGSSGDGADIVVMRYTSGGIPDTTFSGDGIASSGLSGSDRANAVFVSNDKVTVAGTHEGDTVVARFTGAGALDTGFAGDGSLQVALSAVGDDGANAIARTSDGKIVTAGYAWSGSDDNFAVMRLAGDDVTPPNTTIDSSPAPLTNLNDAAFTFSATETSAFVCTLSGGTSAPCSSPKDYPDLADGEYTFEVAATDLAGNPDPSPATFTWTIDTLPPNTSISVNPDALTSSNDPTFEFNSTEGSSSFVCTLDGVADGCASPTSYADVADGEHTFSVVATDPAGNADPTPASWTWTIDTTGPTLSFSSGPASFTNFIDVSFTWTTTEAATHTCALDGGAFTSCSSGEARNGVSEGSHTFYVTSVDGLGNQGVTEGWSFNIDRTDPAASISAPTATFQKGKTFTLGWTGTDDFSGIANLLIRRRVAKYNTTSFSGFTTVTNAGAPGATSFTAVPGYTYCFYNTATDVASNDRTGARRCTAVPVNNTSLSHSSGWVKRTGQTGYYLNSYSESTRAGAYLKLYNVRARKIALLVAKAPGWGYFDVYLGSTFLKRVYTNSSTAQRNVVVFVKGWTTVKTGTLTIKHPTSARVRLGGVGISPV